MTEAIWAVKVFDRGHLEITRLFQSRDSARAYANQIVADQGDLYHQSHSATHDIFCSAADTDLFAVVNLQKIYP